MTIDALIQQLKSDPRHVTFGDVMAVIDDHYSYSPTCFHNGLGDDQIINAAGNNEGSCKIFAFAQLNQLNAAQTLACFGDYYFKEVLGDPDGEGHANIRNFMRHGWPGISFDCFPLTPK